MNAIGEVLSSYRFLTYSRDSEQGGIPLYSMLPENSGEFNTFAELDNWYTKKQNLVRDISQNYHTFDATNLANLVTRLEALFTKNVLRPILPQATEVILTELENHRVLLAQTNLVPHLLQVTGGKLNTINPFVLHAAVQTPNFIKEIDLSDCHYLTDADLVSICQSFPYIQKIHLQGCYNLTKASLFTLADLSNLDSASLPPGVFDALTPSEIGFISFRNLKFLSFGDHAPLDPIAFSWINSLTSLETLDLSGIQFLPEALENFTQLLPLLILDDHNFTQKASLIEALGKVKVHKISLQRTNLDKSDILRLISISAEQENQRKRQKITEDDAIVPIRKNLRAIVLESGRFIDSGFSRECSSYNVTIETGHHSRDGSLDAMLGSSYEDGSFVDTGSPYYLALSDHEEGYGEHPHLDGSYLSDRRQNEVVE